MGRKGHLQRMDDLAFIRVELWADAVTDIHKSLHMTSSGPPAVSRPCNRWNSEIASQLRLGELSNRKEEDQGGRPVAYLPEKR